jgi:hypothetical protein
MLEFPNQLKTQFLVMAADAVLTTKHAYQNLKLSLILFLHSYEKYHVPGACHSIKMSKLHMYKRTGQDLAVIYDLYPNSHHCINCPQLTTTKQKTFHCLDNNVTQGKSFNFSQAYRSKWWLETKHT